MTFTQLFLNALRNFLNIIVLLEAKKQTVTMTFTEGNYHLVTLAYNLQKVILNQGLKDILGLLTLPHKVIRNCKKGEVKIKLF